MKKVSKILSAVICILLMLTASIPAFADTTDQAALDARNGVVRVFAYYNDSKLAASGGSGFLINEDTVITSQHVIEEDAKHKLTKVTVLAVADIEIEAKVLSSSEARDFAVLKLDQKINDRAILPLGIPNGFDATSNVYALGFPAIKDYTKNNKINYSPTDVVITGGNVSTVSQMDFTGVSQKYIQHSAKLDFGNSGGPLIYSTGTTASVVGVNRNDTQTGSQYYYSVHIDEVIEVLDTLGIEYTSIGSETVIPQDNGTDTTQQQNTGKKAPIKLSKTAIIGIIAAVVVVIAVVIIILIVSNSKKKAPVIPSYNPAPAPTPAPSGNFGGADTTTLLSNQGGDPNATTVLGTAGTTAHLIRLSNNEKININKPLFKIGKDSTRVDYCVTGNSAVSRYHAAIISRDGKFFIEDQGATNHTYVNEQEIPAKAETQLVNGAKVRLANEKFEFRI